MNEEEKTQSSQEQVERKETPSPTQEEQTKSVLQTAQELKEQIKAENDRREELLKREENIQARNLLSGRTDAGEVKQTPEQQQQSKAQEMADDIVGAFN